MIKFSVVIPARNSAQTIAKTLRSLQDGTRKPDEMLVVDGCSTDQTADISVSLGAQVVLNEKLHAAAARQLGTTSAKYEVIVFIDSDCIAPPDWLEKISIHFENDTRLSGVGGSIVRSETTNYIQEYSANVFEQIMQFPTERTFVTVRGMKGTFAGANCAFRREAILAVGGFRDFFSNHAEEVDLFWRLVEQNEKLLFDPDVKVEHLGYANTLKSLVKANFNYGIASTKLAKIHIGKRVDAQLYNSLLKSILSTLNPISTSENHFLRSIQIAAFVTGKIFASIQYKTVNL